MKTQPKNYKILRYCDSPSIAIVQIVTVQITVNDREKEYWLLYDKQNGSLEPLTLKETKQDNSSETFIFSTGETLKADAKTVQFVQPQCAVSLKICPTTLLSPDLAELTADFLVAARFR